MTPPRGLGVAERSANGAPWPQTSPDPKPSAPPAKEAYSLKEPIEASLTTRGSFVTVRRGRR